MKPPRSILDKGFRYTSAAATDVSKTFARIRKQQEANKAEAEQKVKPIIKMKRIA